LKNINLSCSNTIPARVKKLLSLKKVSIDSCPSPALLSCKWVLTFLLGFCVLMFSSKCSSVISLSSKSLCLLFFSSDYLLFAFFQFWPVPPQPWGCFPPFSAYFSPLLGHLSTLQLLSSLLGPLYSSLKIGCIQIWFISHDHAWQMVKKHIGSWYRT
jgi:hypothetical protein